MKHTRTLPLYILIIICSCIKNPISEQQFKDPEGTITLDISSLKIDNTIYVENGNFKGALFRPLGKIQGLGYIDKIPKDGWVTTTAAIDGNGYIAWSDGVYYRLFVDEYNGYQIVVKCQFPFDGNIKEIKIEKDELLVSPESNKISIPIIGEYLFPFDVSSDANWCTVSGKSSKSDYPYDLIDLSVSNNRDAKRRECIALIANTKEMKQKIRIVQQGAPESIEQSHVYFSGGQESRRINVVASGDWIVESDQHWCHAIKTGADIVISVDENVSGTVRNAKVTVKTDSGNSFGVSVEQSMPEFDIPETYTVNFRPSVATIKIANIVKWTVSSDASWCSVHNDGYYLIIQTSQNNECKSRICNLTVDAGYAQYQIQLCQSGRTINYDGYLINYEIPLVESIKSSSVVPETKGGGNAYIYETEITNQRIVTHTFANGDKSCRNYSFLYDYDKRCPMWLAYHQHIDFSGTTMRTNDYGYDPAIPQDKQQTNYSNGNNDSPSSYLKGQMLFSFFRTCSENANRQIFYYTNLPPHHNCFHAGGAVWNALAYAEDDIIPSSDMDTLYVVTGAYFDREYETITNRDGIICPVPTHFYKCFMLCSFDSTGKIKSARGRGFFIPHHKTPEEKTPAYGAYSKTIDEIEDIIGYDLFANIPDELQDYAESVNRLDL